MCVEYKTTCVCGTNSASFNFRDEIMPVEVVDRLYCPDCSTGVIYDPETMIRDNDWIIKYDMEIAHFMRRKLPVSEMTPGFIFDEGYCTWRGIYPNDHLDSLREREELVKLAATDRKKYLEEFKFWGARRMQRLAREGWRKANEER
jgi:hypothetical protein